jgi:hypothetical protein
VKVRFVKVRLIRKLAECIDGVNLAGVTVGEVVDLPPSAALLLIAEQWAIPHVVAARAAIGSLGPNALKKQPMKIPSTRRRGRPRLPRDP